MLGDYFKILKKRNFFLLWAGQIISQFGDRLTQMALIGLVYRIMPYSSLSLAKIMSLSIIPVFLISPVAGVYIDRWNKQKTMYMSDFLRSALIALIPIVAFQLRVLPLVYLCIFFSSCVGRFFIPAKMSIIPHLIEKKERLMANSLVSTTAMIAAIFGFGIGGVMVEKWGVGVAFLVDAFTFFLSALLVSLMRMKEKANFYISDLVNLSKDAIVKVKNSFLFEMKEGLKYFLNTKQTRYASGIFFLLFSCLGSLYVVFIVFIQNTLHSVTQDLGWLAVSAGLGLFLGSLLYGRLGKEGQIKRIINLSLLLGSGYLTFFVIVLKYHSFKIFALVSCLLLGIISSPIVIGINTLIHNESKDQFWGRIFSALEILIHLAFIIFMFISSFLAEKFSPFTIIVSVGIIIFSFSLYNLLRRERE